MSICKLSKYKKYFEVQNFKHNLNIKNHIILVQKLYTLLDRATVS